MREENFDQSFASVILPRWCTDVKRDFDIQNLVFCFLKNIKTKQPEIDTRLSSFDVQCIPYSIQYK